MARIDVRAARGEGMKFQIDTTPIKDDPGPHTILDYGEIGIVVKVPEHWTTVGPGDPVVRGSGQVTFPKSEVFVSGDSLGHSDFRVRRLRPGETITFGR